MTTFTKKSTTLKSALMAAVLATGALAATSSAANAMKIHNCTPRTIVVEIIDKNGLAQSGYAFDPGDNESFPLPGSLGPYRIKVGNIAGNHFSGRDGNGIYSIKQNVAGNYIIQNGNRCQAPAPKPIEGGGNDRDQNGRVCFEGFLGRVCLEN